MKSVTAALLLIVCGGCRHAQPPIDLSQVLRLETAGAPSEARAGETIEATYKLENLSSQPLNLCSANGVSIMLKSESPAYLWPMLLHGLTTDVECSGPIHLDARGAVTFTEHGAIRRDLPDSKPVLLGRFSVWCARGLSCRETTLESSVVLHVVRAPSNSALEPTSARLAGRLSCASIQRAEAAQF